MTKAAALTLFLALAGCAGAANDVCKAFPEWNELGYQNDVEHDAHGAVQSGIAKLAGQVAEVFVDPACASASKAGIVAK